MDQKITPVTEPTIEDVRNQFEQWRKDRKHRSPIPANLWEGAVSLIAEHSINTVSRSLRIGYTPLKRRLLASRSKTVRESMTSSDFVALDLRTSMAAAEYILEKEGKSGLKMRLHIKGQLGLHPLELMKAFLGKGQ
jgi:hypothetical protein